jgi:hypothetical protein
MKLNSNKLFIITLCLSSTALFYTACKKAENFNGIANPSVNNRANTLSLAEKNGLTNAINEIRNMNDEQFEAWEKEKGFISLRHYQTELLKKIESKADFTQAEWDLLAKEYANIAYFDEIGRFKPKFSSATYSSLVNKCGELYIGGALIYFDEEKVISVVDGDRKKLEAAKQGVISNSENEYISQVKAVDKSLRSVTQVVSSAGEYSWVTSDNKTQNGKQKYKGNCTLRYVNRRINVSPTNPAGQLIIDIEVGIQTEYRPSLAFGTWWAYRSNHSLSYYYSIKPVLSSFPVITGGQQYIPNSSSSWNLNIAHFEEIIANGQPYEVSCQINATSSTPLGNLNYAH